MYLVRTWWTGPVPAYYREGHPCTSGHNRNEATVYESRALAELRAATINEFTADHGIRAEVVR